MWSPLGSRLAFSGLTSGSNGSGHIRLHVHDLTEEPAKTVYDNEPGADGIAPRTPHYTLWSPDGQRLAFVARTWTGGLSLFVWDRADEGPHERLLEGGPLFLSWSPDSRYLLVHAGRDHYLLDFQADGRIARMPGSSGSYMAPSWSPDSNRLALFRQGPSGRQSLLVGDTAGGASNLVAEVEGNAAFAWSPDGRMMGLVRDIQGRSRFYGGLWVVDAGGGGARRLAEELILCFFWSPSGREIAYITPSEGAEGSLRWALVHLEDGTVRYLADFRPTEEQLTAYMFFDQFVQSHDPWSPNGRSLIFSGALPSRGPRRPAAVP